jgi:hypothetical protein
MKLRGSFVRAMDLGRRLHSVEGFLLLFRSTSLGRRLGFAEYVMLCVTQYMMGSEEQETFMN